MTRPDADERSDRPPGASAPRPARKRARRAAARKGKGVEAGAAAGVEKGAEQPAGFLASVRASLPNRWELLAWAILLSIALGLRLWGLGDRALHHDESLHATYSWYLFEGRGYHHDPMMHGAFQFHAGALAFVLFGDSDFVARVPAALLGTGMVALVWLLRGYLGRLGALSAAVFIAFSPTLLYFSRFAREDIYTAFWTLGIVIFMWRYLAERRNLWLYLAAAFMAFSFATKETTYMTVAIFLTFMEGWVALDFLGQMRRQRKMDWLEVGSTLIWLVAFSWLLVILWPLLTPIRRRWGLDELPGAGVLLLVLGTLAAPQYAGVLQLIGDHVPFLPGNSGYRSAAEEGLRNGSVTVLLLLTLYVGLLWNPRVWLICAAAFYGVYVLLFTTFFTNPAGFWSGIWGSTDYWIEQQSVRRGDQPVFYYFMLLPVYEFLTLLVAVGGVVWLALRRNVFTVFLIFWIAASVLAFTMAAEKMPWLTVHMALPIALLAGRAVNELYAGMSLPRGIKPAELLGRVASEPIVALAVASAATVLAVVLLIVLSASAMAVVLAVLLAAVAAAAVLVADQVGRRAAVQVGTAAVIAGVLVFSIRTAGVASFEHGDIPVELLVYTQSSPDIPRLRDAIEEVADATGLGRDVPIYYDDSDSRAWPWVWYLRDFHNVTFGPPERAEQGDILLVSPQNTEGLEIDLSQYDAGQPFVHRWWFPERYRVLMRDTMWDILFSPDTWGTWRDFFVNREAVVPRDSLGTLDSVAYFPKSFIEATGTPVYERPPEEPVAGPDGQVIVGSSGGGRGQFSTPAGLAVDAQGNLYVADSGNRRIQKFDSDLHFLGVLGAAGDTESRLNEPWAVAVDGQGNIYVADTWNHRIQKYDADFQFQKTWGRPFVDLGQREPEPLELFGPRSIAVDAEGNLWVTDTGNKRVLKFSPEGEPLGQYGGAGSGPGQFDEPVGIAVAPNGEIYVADAWNSRIQRFSPAFEYLGEIAVDTWGSQEVSDKPYLAILGDGTIVASDPAASTVLVFDSAGQAVASWELPGSGLTRGRPLGLAVGVTGDIFVADGAGGQVRRVPLATLLGP